MVTIAQRIEALRTEKGLSRPALAAAVKLPRMSIEKFETGRQTPSQEQQKMLAAYFGVSVSYLKGESDDPTSMESWLNGNVPDEPMTPCPRSPAGSCQRRAGKGQGGRDGLRGAPQEPGLPGHDQGRRGGVSPLSGGAGPHCQSRPAGAGQAIRF